MELICDTRYAFIVTTMNSKTSVCPKAVNIQLIMSNKTCHTQQILRDTAAKFPFKTKVLLLST